MIKVSRKINRTCTEGNNVQFFMIQAIKKQIFFFFIFYVTMTEIMLYTSLMHFRNVPKFIKHRFINNNNNKKSKHRSISFYQLLFVFFLISNK